MRQLFFLFLLLTAMLCLAQEKQIKGKVLSKLDGQPVMGASVFYDGTSIGTVTNENGFFELTTRQPINSILVVQYLGYKSVYLENIDTSFVQIVLEEKVEELDEVVLEPDTWSRVKKLRVFKREFLGSQNHGCSILNVDDIRFYYKSSERKLFAYADKPLEIINEKLKYTILYYLEDFEVEFYDDSALAISVLQTYFAGVSQFTDLEEKPSERTLRLRKKAYLGSVMHFFRAMYNDMLFDEGFGFLKGSFPTSEENAFSYSMENGILVVEQKLKKVGILYNREQSFIKLLQNRYMVDAYGVFAPPKQVLFGGQMGKFRAGTMLPKDYKYTE